MIIPSESWSNTAPSNTCLGWMNIGVSRRIYMFYKKKNIKSSFVYSTPFFSGVASHTCRESCWRPTPVFEKRTGWGPS